MERKERVHAYICSDEYIPLTAGELAAVLDVPQEDREELGRILKELQKEEKIYLTKKERYAPCVTGEPEVCGALECKARGYFGFVTAEDGEDVFVKGDDMNGALNGDIVCVKIKSGCEGPLREGYVSHIIERMNKIAVGVFVSDDSRYYKLRPDNAKLYTKIRVSPLDMMDAEMGDRAAVEITRYDEEHVFGRVLAVLGKGNSIKSQVEGIIIEHGIKQDFDEDTLEETCAVPENVPESVIRDRLDLRDKFIFTIDGRDAKDFDDAVSLEMLDNGSYSLGVHIADVTHYVKEGSALDREAFLRGTSVYLADRVIPMLPERLSNGICSLKPGEDRLALSVIMEIDKTGRVLSHRLERSVINSKERMTYDNVTRLLEGHGELDWRYGYMKPTLQKMRELAELLEKMRVSRGAMDFDFPEISVRVDENSEPVEITTEERGISNRIIEQFMLTANETVAEYAAKAEIPFVYRVHEPPSDDNIKAFGKFISRFGMTLKGRIDGEHPVHPRALQKILEDAKGTPEERMIASQVLHSLMKAEYSPENKGHFGLSAKYYCHFTSPIRRYPDLMVHRILKEFAGGNVTDTRRAELCGLTADASAQSSMTEAEAENTERDVNDLMKAAYMTGFVGQEFKGVISGITGFGMFVEVENAVEGLIRLENMHGDFFEYDEYELSLTGKKTGETYRIGDEVDVVLMRSDVTERRIDFVLSHDMTADVRYKYELMDKIIPQPLNKRAPRRRGKKRRRR